MINFIKQFFGKKKNYYRHKETGKVIKQAEFEKLSMADRYDYEPNIKKK